MILNNDQDEPPPWWPCTPHRHRSLAGRAAGLPGLLTSIPCLPGLPGGGTELVVVSTKEISATTRHRREELGSNEVL